MKKALLMTMALVLIAIPAAAQQGYLGLFGDPQGENCFLLDNVPGLVSVYVVHMDSPGASAAEFMVDLGTQQMVFLADVPTPGYVTIGTSTTGVAIGYAGCVASPNVVLRMDFFANGLSAPCSVIELLENPDSGQIQVVDCEADGYNLVPVEGRGMFINPNENCEDCGLVPVGTEQNTWGSLKSIFR